MRSGFVGHVLGLMVSAPVLLGAAPVSGQGADLLSDRSVRILVEETLIADLMLRSCLGLVASEEGMAEVQRIADDLARKAGYSPEAAAARLSEPEVAKQIEAGARRRLAMMGANPEDLEAVCAAASHAVNVGGVIGTLLALSPAEME